MQQSRANMCVLVAVSNLVFDVIWLRHEGQTNDVGLGPNGITAAEKHQKIVVLLIESWVSDEFFLLWMIVVCCGGGIVAWSYEGGCADGMFGYMFCWCPASSWWGYPDFDSIL